MATSSLELGIDMGAVDLVVQVESPGAVSRGLQRIGRAGHQVGEPSRGKLFPKHRHDLLEAAVVVQRMHEGLIESTRYPRNPLDVLAQQIVAMVALDDWKVDELAAWCGGRPTSPSCPTRCSTPCSTCSRAATRPTSSPSCGPASCGTGSRAWSGAGPGPSGWRSPTPGTIPDRGLFGVFLPDGARVGELDEEMVYESRAGETFLLGATTWRIEDITHDRVVVTPAPGQPGKMPFWHGDGPGRPLELGRALGAFVRELRACPGGQAWLERLRTVHGLDEAAAANLLAYLDEQAEATGAVPDDRTIVVERFRDEIGDWRVCVLSPFGAQVHAPWGMALKARLAERWGVEVELIWSDDGIVIRLPEALDDAGLDRRPGRSTPTRSTTSSASCPPRRCSPAASGRPRPGPCCCPGAGPTGARPLWQQRQRRPTCWRWPALPELPDPAGGHPRVPQRRVRPAGAARGAGRHPQPAGAAGRGRDARASPFAQSLLFGWIAVYMYEGDAPLAERRAAALALDRDLLDDLLGAEELRELLDAGVLADLELELQSLVDGRRARDADELHDLLRRLGPAVARRARRPRARAAGRRPGSSSWWPSGGPSGRVAGEERVAAAEDAGRCATPWASPCPWACRRRSPTRSRSRWSTWSPASPAPTGRSLAHQVAGRFGCRRPGRRRPRSSALGPTAGWCRASSGPTASSASGATSRCCASCGGGRWPRCATRSSRSTGRGAGPVPARVAGHRLAAPRVDALVEVLAQLQGAPLPASVLEADVLPARLAGYRPADLDALCTAASWCGWAPGPSGPPTAGCGWCSATRPGCWCRAADEADELPDGAAAPRRCSTAWSAGRLVLGRPGAGRAARPTSPTTTPRCSPRCGTWCGRARSPTTRSPRCGPFVGGKVRKAAGRGAARRVTA